MPLWVVALEVGAAWGVPPWKVWDWSDERAVWVERFLAWREAQAKRAKTGVRDG